MRYFTYQVTIKKCVWMEEMCVVMGSPMTSSDAKTDLKPIIIIIIIWKMKPY